MRMKKVRKSGSRDANAFLFARLERALTDANRKPHRLNRHSIHSPGNVSESGNSQPTSLTSSTISLHSLHESHFTLVPLPLTSLSAASSSSSLEASSRKVGMTSVTLIKTPSVEYVAV
eukprot:GHVN01054439.1.p1 GENE.GHVN01054439.1~~GHVN01054439.1.p1  ORF type:complete len:118 (+),score=21.30 GHVN01054439.1:419-772(+)